MDQTEDKKTNSEGEPQPVELVSSKPRPEPAPPVRAAHPSGAVVPITDADDLKQLNRHNQPIVALRVAYSRQRSQYVAQRREFEKQKAQWEKTEAELDRTLREKEAQLQAVAGSIAARMFDTDKEHWNFNSDRMTFTKMGDIVQIPK